MMNVILGGTGHVGSAAADALLHQGKPVTIVTHDPAKREDWMNRGAEVAVADVHDTEALRQVFRQGKRLFLLNPPADPSTDTDAEERKTVTSIVAALEGSGLEKIVAESTYGAQPGERCGDLNILYGLEQALAAQPIPVSIIRAAYYFSNWDASLVSARNEGVVQSMYPADFELPMVAPQNLGEVAANLLGEPVERTGTHYVEGPGRYTPADVAEAFAGALGKRVKFAKVPRKQWKQAYQNMGFSKPAAESYARMTAATLDDIRAKPETPVRGSTSLQSYIAVLAGA
jgi:uncharacterized protein YbjT (DUF2867 family)